MTFYCQGRHILIVRGFEINCIYLNFLGSICPGNEDEAISPCTCVLNSAGVLSILCEGQDVTQESVDNVVRVTRQVNNLSSADLLDLSQFEVRRTDLKQFDLSPLVNISMDALDISGNEALSSLVGPVSDLDEAHIHVTSLIINSNPNLGDSGLSSIFKMFNPLKMTELNLNSL